MSTILSLSLDQIHRDDGQPRKSFDINAMDELKTAIARYGQMQPIIVRLEEDKYYIVDGERRWRALKELNAKDPSNHDKVMAVISSESEGSAPHRKARQMILNGTAQDLTPSEKADTIQALQQAVPDKSENYGLTAGNLRFLKRLANAPDYIRIFGSPRNYTINKTSDKGSKSEKRELPPLSLTHLLELISLDNGLREWDVAQMKATKNAHRAIAGREVKRIGESAQKEEWSRSKLKRSCAKVLSSIQIGKRSRSQGTDIVVRSLRSTEERMRKIFDGENNLDVSEIRKILDTINELIVAAEQRKNASQPAA